MSEELLKSKCKEIIESKESTAISTLMQTISNNKQVITDENEFYSFILKCLVDNLQVVEVGKEEKTYKLDDLSVEKLRYFEAIITNYPTINFYEQLIRLANYNLKEVYDVFIFLTEYHSSKEKIRKYLKDHIGDISNNSILVRRIIEFSEFTTEDLELLVSKVLELNKEIKELTEEENKRLSTINTDVNSQDEEHLNIKQEIEALKSKRNSIISTIQKIIYINGVEKFEISNDLLMPIFESGTIEGISISNSLMNYDIVHKILRSEKTLSNLDLPNLVDKFVEFDYFNYAEDFLLKMSDEQLSNTKSLNDIVENILNSNKMQEYKEFFERISKSDVLYMISPRCIMQILESLHSDKIKIGPNNKLLYEISEEKLVELSATVYQIIKNSTDKENKVEGFYEKFVVELLRNKRKIYEKSIVYILKNYKLNMAFDVNDAEPKMLDFVICSEGTKEVLKEYLSIPYTRLSIHGNIGHIDIFNVYLRAEEYDKAREEFDNRYFSFLGKEKEKDLLNDGKCSFIYNPIYIDSFSQAVETIFEKVKKHPKLMELLKYMILSGKVRALSIDAHFPLMMLAYQDTELLKILKNKCINGDFIFFRRCIEETECSSKLILASKEEIKDNYYWLDPKEWLPNAKVRKQE